MPTPSEALLARLVAFDTVTLQPNLALIEAVRELLAAHGIASTLVRSEDGTRANLHASVGPADVPGVLLSGHTDVVPAAGQAWTVPPFALTERDGLLYGRGTADMKGFVACAVNAMLRASGRPLRRPLQLALSYDEEIGCVGVRRLLEVMETAPVRPALCIVGEPTSMQIATGHKGKMALRAVCQGLEGHSALAPRALNAIHLACDLVGAMRALQDALRARGARDPAYDVPYATVHAGCIHGGRALNIVPNECTVDFEIRHLAQDDPDALLAPLRQAADGIREQARRQAPAADIRIETVNAYPGLDTHPASEAVRFVESLLPAGTGRTKVAFGTEGGLFTRHLDVPVVVCGPGSIVQAHKPDEYVSRAQLAECDAFMERLVAAL
ncbi:acetylornithine deacetylase [Achromobacter denitrificans]|jgi:acetylornithine deacetylase|uniref:acetylornithine deacetylase n=1 Tax=Achromobacter denitrificans TaxID=32002 RepID=UPI00078851FA|nr:acetylornithine deacetylase [Achromobacter denitrificans]MDX3881913.1 acetylornithine deacetylase [Achromobacter sp.]MBV2162326.1 acetylornithine deacetylase [Achromobacter denitrificans]OLT99894.1 acetylornithine deacetylase [Achromobacter denitrificans]QKH41051.1 acetylornithine deacetylase [Achromobacter denitrificans]QKH51803.1 acetylornithine deacetylase [Achromobacter denitrificans]